MSQTREINLIPYDVIVREKTQGRIWMWAVVILLVTIVAGKTRVMNECNKPYAGTPKF